MSTPHRRRMCLLGASALLVTATLTREYLQDHEDSPIRRAAPAESALLVTVRGVGICSGAPIEHTRLVVTAAHCLLDPRTGQISTRHDLRVERDGVRYDIEAIIIDPASTVETVVPARDGAVLVLTATVTGPGVRLPREAAEPGTTTHRAVIIGNQPVDTTGAFHRGREYHDRSTVEGASPGATYVGHVPAACDVGEPLQRNGFLVYPCGMVPGGSGGPVVERGENTLIGVVSSVNRTLTRNGIVPVDEILRLLGRADRFTVFARDLDALAQETEPSSTTGGDNRRR